MTGGPQQMFSPTNQGNGMSYQTKKSRFHNWNILHKQNKKLDNESQLKNYDLRKAS